MAFEKLKKFVRDLRFQWRHDDYIAECRARGLRPEQIADDLLFRNAWVKFRREANAAVIAWPEGAEKEVARLAKKLAMTELSRKPMVAKCFLSAVENSNFSDILYSDGMKALLSYQPMGLAEPTADNYAAINTLKS